MIKLEVKINQFTIDDTLIMNEKSITNHLEHSRYY